MKKVILMTVVSLFVFSGMMLGLWERGQAGAQPSGAEFVPPDYSGVEAIILISKGNNLSIVPGPGITFRTPKDSSGNSSPQNDPPGPKKERDRATELPIDLKDEIKSAKFKTNEIISYGENTCVRVNQTLYCW